MQFEHVTVPFGRRPASLGQFRQQQLSAQPRKEMRANKWKVFRDASIAFEQLRLQSNSLAVLDALLSFYPEADLHSGALMIVFPSNVHLCLRAHNMAGATLRRHLTALVNAGLIIRRDSANGKRFARKNSSGSVETAFGFDLSPLLSRSEELAAMAREVQAARNLVKRTREDLTIVRRTVRKLISAAMMEGQPGRWVELDAAYIAVATDIPRSPSLELLQQALARMQSLYEEVVNELRSQENCKNMSSDDKHNEQQIQNSKPESSFEPEDSLKSDSEEVQQATNRTLTRQQASHTLDMVLRGCPTIRDYGPKGAVISWHDLKSAAGVARLMLGVTSSAYEQACNIMGVENAATVIACILERGEKIVSAGGYLRDLTKRMAAGRFSIAPMLTSLLRQSL